MTSEQLVAAIFRRNMDRAELAYDVSILLSVIDELKEKIDTYINRRKEDEKRIAELEAENARLRLEHEEVLRPLLDAGEAWQRCEPNSEQALGVEIAKAREAIRND